MKNRGGSALLLAIMVSAVLMVLAVILTKMVYNSCLTADCLLRREEAFWLAEAGLERGRMETRRNPGWYTDLPHFPEDDVAWLKTGAVGRRENLGKGFFKAVRELGGEGLYAVGCSGTAVVILKLKGTDWKEI
jgi:hypothetical protein